MKTITVVGAGKIGSTIASMLAETGDYRVELVDRSEASLHALPARPRLTHRVVDVATEGALAETLAGSYAVISALPFHLTTAVATAAISAGVHYLDLTEDVASTRFVKGMAATASAALIPQCGLAPGFISIVASDMASDFDSLDSIRMRVGALPQFPSNGLNYSLTWSTDGVINEYCEPCEAITNGRLVSVPPLEEREEFSLDGVLYEAFNTSGGLGTLCETLSGKVRRLNYKTVRYPGHAAIMKVLLDDLRLGARRELLKDILEQSLPTTRQDVVVIFVSVSGMKQGRLVEEIYAKKIYSRGEGPSACSAIQLTTASAACAVLDLLAEGTLPATGLVRQEDIPMAAFLANRFGGVYRPDGSGTTNSQGRQEKTAEPHPANGARRHAKAAGLLPA